MSYICSLPLTTHQIMHKTNELYKWKSRVEYVSGASEWGFMPPKKTTKDKEKQFRILFSFYVQH